MTISSAFQSLLGINSQPDPYQQLLGNYYDPKQARMYLLGNTLKGLGYGLSTGDWRKASEIPSGSMDEYRKQALGAYTINRQQGEDAWNQKERARKESEWAQEDASTAQLNSLLGNISDPQERLYAQLNPEAYVKSKLDPGGGQSTYFGTPLPYTNEDGSFGFALPGKNGGVGPLVAPPGAHWQSPYQKAEQTAAGSMAGSAPTSVIEDYSKKARPEMANLSDTIATLGQAKTYLNKGIQTGSMSDKVQALRSLGAQFGFNVDENVLSNTQSYQNFIGNVVIPRMASLGGNDSNEELQKLYSLSGGDINQSLPALVSTLDFMDKLMRRKFKMLKAQEDVALKYIPGLTPVPLGELDPAATSGAGPIDFSTMSDDQLEAIANGRQ